MPQGMPKRKPKSKQDSKSQKNTTQSTKSDNVSQKPLRTVPVAEQQAVLDVFKTSFITPGGSSVTSTTILQEVKGHLYNREFDLAFGRAEYLETYAARWSPSRALAYLAILHTYMPQNGVGEVLALGAGGGAEVVALSAWQRGMETGQSRITAVDVADWTLVLENLRSTLLHSDLVFERHDILHLSEEQLRRKAIGLVTLLFTLNELYSASLSDTTRFLHRLTAAVNPGVRLLVVDSPGSYSTLSVGGSDRKYPMHFLLDHTLLSEDEGTKRWEKVESVETQWFRRHWGLEYPIDLEDMRFQLHLYQRLS